MIALSLFLAAAVSVGAPAGECVLVEGDRILASDLASANAAFSGVPQDTQFGFAPAPGARRIFRVAELDRLAARYGLLWAPKAEICFERPMEPVTPERLLAAMHSALNVPGARIEILEFSRHPVPRGEMEFPRSSLAEPPAAQPQTGVLWKGYIRYAANRKCTIWARVKVLAAAERLVSAVTLAAQQPILREQVRRESFEGFPLRDSLTPSIEQVIGRLPRRSIPAGSPIQLNLLDAPKDVRSGETVRVEVRSGGARLELEGRAEGAGRRGESIPVRNPLTGKTFTARVEGRGKVAVTTENDGKGASR